jgi:hypothetical protein
VTFEGINACNVQFERITQSVALEREDWSTGAS